MADQYKRKYVFTWLRQVHDENQVLSTRRFARLDTCIPRAVQLLLLEGHPRDVIEIAHADHGFQIATVKIHAGGKFTIEVSKEL